MVYTLMFKYFFLVNLPNWCYLSHSPPLTRDIYFL